MFIYNFKINGSKVFKSFLFIVIILIIIITGIVTFKLFAGASENNDSTCMSNSKVAKLTASNYTNILKTVHEDIDKYIGQQISFTGYVYRVSDLNEDQFILARDMLISSDYQSVIVGFLCEYDKANELENNSWVEITGTITKGNYHGDIPIIKITEIKKVNKPNEEYVYPPNENYIQTDIL